MRPIVKKMRSAVLPLFAMCLVFWRVQFGSPTPRATFEHLLVLEETVEHGALNRFFCVFPPSQRYNRTLRVRNDLN